MRPAVIGHRGLGCGVVAGHQQNTISSIGAAVHSGARWVEADVRRLADDVLVVAHDAAYPDGTRLADITGAEADRRGTLRLSTLLAELPHRVGINLDLKSSMDDCLPSPGQTTAGLLAPVVAAEATRRPLMVSSFDPAALWLLRLNAPRVPLGLLTWHRFPVEMAVAACVHMDVEVLALHVGSLRSGTARGQIDSGVLTSLLSLLHRCGRQLLVWCPQIALARLLVSAGTDAVVVDDLPEALVALSPSPQPSTSCSAAADTSPGSRPQHPAAPSALPGWATQRALRSGGQADAHHDGGG
ncbi:glycerophosphodiester phosphodiesterase [Blastococcus brunescens]|uniref:Glycerophosphodiester phosphodiesterase n=1 Tax=Blastococcus brunescens TaxID=1564165 RepID=A0ABZ1AUN0_9ACTN|nr:glycerophosphodiester phosphodiesterase [Blastococcus sp. BMG 8361]WRL61847.1 glycerophosphodiester phosphodiesterase [Blastococcus sp. BMG 8361]